MQTTVTALLGLVSLFISWILMLILPGIKTAAWILLGIGILLLIIAFIVDFRRVRSALVSRRGRFGTGTTLMVSIFIGIILLVNAISISNFHTFDFTGLSQFTLTSQTKEALTDKLDKPVEILCFFAPDNPVKEYSLTLLKEYENYSNQLSVKAIDPTLYPDQANQYGVVGTAAEYGTVVFKTEDGQRLVYGPEIAAEAEHAFTSAILEVSGIIQKKVYFLTGHGEGDIESTTETGFSQAYDGLRTNLFQVGTLNLLFTHKIPEDCAALVIAGPREPLENEEIEIIKGYIENRGPVVILLNPYPPPQMKQLLANWDIQIDDGLIVDPGSYSAPSVDTPLVPKIRNSLGLSTTYYPGATALIPEYGYMPAMIPGAIVQIIWSNEDTNIEMFSLIRSSKDSWLEKDFNPYENPEFHEGVDVKGPLSIGFLITTASLTQQGEEEMEEIEDRFIVIGDSDFASNKNFAQGNNSDLFLSSINWLTAEEEIISIDRKVFQVRRLIIDRAGTRFLNYSSIGLLPILILAIGSIVWWRRR